MSWAWSDCRIAWIAWIWGLSCSMDHFFSRGNPSPSSSAAHPICGSNKASAESLHTPQHSKCGLKESGNAHSFIGVFVWFKLLGAEVLLWCASCHHSSIQMTSSTRGSKSNHRIRVPNFGKASKLSRYFISVFFTLESCNSKKGAHVNLFVLPVNRLENRLKVQNFMNGIHPVLPTHTIPGWSCMSGHQVQTSSAKKRHRQRGEATKTADFAKWLGLSILLKKAEWTSLRQKLQTFHTIVFQPQVEGCIVRTNELLATFPAAFFKPANPGTETKHVRIHEFAWRSSWSECRRDQDPEKLFWTNNLYIFTSENCRA